VIARLRLRKRATFLVMFGVLYVLVGVNVAVGSAARFESIPLVGPALDHPAWSALWAGAGLLAIGAALRPDRAGRARDAAGFVALLVPPALWTLFYVISLIAWLTGTGGASTAGGGALAYAFTWSVVMLAAGWPNPPAPDPNGRRRRLESTS
jgi:hypothetical protein